MIDTSRFYTPSERQERRKALRLRNQAALRVWPIGSNRQDESPGHADNISAGGICFSSQVAFSPGSELEIEVLAGNHPEFHSTFRSLHAKLSVLRVEGEAPPYRVAGAFVSVS